jgi:hypothetical protein
MNLSIALPPVLLLIGCFAYIFWPQAPVAKMKEKGRIDYLRERKDVIYDNLRDLNFEFKAGKYPEEDFTRQRDELEGEAAVVLAEIDSLGS